MHATRLIWEGAGSPIPFDYESNPIPKAKEKLWGRCACCGSPDGHWGIKDVISSNFVQVKNDSRISPYGGHMYCAACVFCARTLRLRCCSWFATKDEIRFWMTRPLEQGGPRPDVLETLLNPPEPPFVVGIPLYGISHGGEAHWKRAPWPGDKPSDVLSRLQSKHVAIYSRVAMSRDRFPVQVNDDVDFVLDVAQWKELRSVATDWMRCAVESGVPPYPSKKALLTLSAPNGVRSSRLVEMAKLTRLLKPHADAQWWPVFCEFIPALPEIPREKKSGNKAAKRDQESAVTSRERESPATGAVLSDSGNRAQHAGNRDGARQVQLALF